MTDKPTPLARRMEGIEPFHVMELLVRAKALEAQGRTIIHMEIGEPDFPTPRPVCEAGIRALEQGSIFYTPAMGLPALREKISNFYRDRYGVEVSPSRIVVTPGSSGALLLAVAVLVDPGAAVVMSDPSYPCNRHFVRLMGGEAVGVPVGADSNYQLTAELIEQHWTDRTVAALVATPSNPTGTLIPTAQLEAMAAFAAQRRGTLIVDEIYHGLVYEGEAKTALSAPHDVFVINSFSKFFNMTGWRLGWLVVPERYVREVDKVAQNVYISAPAPSQYAALAAFAPETMAILEERRQAFKARRDFLVPELRKLGFDIPRTPEGAFYIYAGCAQLTGDSYAFAYELLEQAGVAITPGIDFGRHAPERHVRFAYTNSIERLQEGVARIARFLGR